MKKILGCLVVGLMLASGMVRADVFISEGVVVEAVADSGVKAKEAAMAEGVSRAFSGMIAKMALVEDKTKLPSLAPEEVGAFVKDVIIESEKTTATKYSGVIDVRFKDDEVQKFLKVQKIPYSTQEGSTFVVIPVWKEAGNVSVLGNDNPMYGAVKAYKGSVYKFVVPAVSEDVTAAVNGDHLASVSNLLGKYNANHILWIAVEKKEAIYHLQAKEFPVDASDGVSDGFVVSSTIKDMNVVAEKLFKKLNGEMEKGWRQKKLAEMSEAQVIEVSVPVSSLADWTVVRQKVEKVSGIDQYVIRSMKKEEIMLNVFSAQPVNKLVAQFKRVGLTLEKDWQGNWILFNTVPGGNHE